MNKKSVLFGCAVVLMLAACGGGGSGGNDPIAQAVMGNGSTPTVQAQTLQKAQPAMQATTPTPQPATVEQTQQVITQWATVIVQQTVVVIVTPTPDIQGFTAPVNVAGNEEPQPCPAGYWRNRRCTATQAQIEAAAQGGN